MRFTIKDYQSGDYFIDAEIEITDYDYDKPEPDVGYRGGYEINDFKVHKYSAVDIDGRDYVLFSVNQIKAMLMPYAFSTIQEQFNERMN